VSAQTDVLVRVRMRGLVVGMFRTRMNQPVCNTANMALVLSCFPFVPLCLILSANCKNYSSETGLCVTKSDLTASMCLRHSATVFALTFPQYNQTGCTKSSFEVPSNMFTELEISL
jgi:hypothetical protein